MNSILSSAVHYGHKEERGTKKRENYVLPGLCFLWAMGGLQDQVGLNGHICWYLFVKCV